MCHAGKHCLLYSISDGESQEDSALLQRGEIGAAILDGFKGIHYTSFNG